MAETKERDKKKSCLSLGVEVILSIMVVGQKQMRA